MDLTFSGVLDPCKTLATPLSTAACNDSTSTHYKNETCARRTFCLVSRRSQRLTNAACRIPRGMSVKTCHQRSCHISNGVVSQSCRLILPHMLRRRCPPDKRRECCTPCATAIAAIPRNPYLRQTARGWCYNPPERVLGVAALDS